MASTKPACTHGFLPKGFGDIEVPTGTGSASGLDTPSSSLPSTS